jgi:NAD(P)-dependent dehydrogenase (short-subunit alcohol dehydrogenase family)
MSKAGVHVMTQSLAVEWAKHGIRLNAIAPGPFPTEGMSARLSPGRTAEERAAAKNPTGRIGRMEEIRNLATFLVADGCDWLTGQTIALDGAGYLAGVGSFHDLRSWTDADWLRAREMIKARNEQDRAQRG